MKMVKINQLDEILAVLKKGGVIALPTDTAYALAADATNPEAVRKVFIVKKRPAEKQLSWFFADLDQVKQFTKIVNYQLSILKQYLPGPYTFIVPSKTTGTIGVRITNHPITQQVVKVFGKPLTATSANLSDQPPIRTVDGLKNFPVDLIVDGGTIPGRGLSTVVDLTKIPYLVTRKGLGEFPNIHAFLR